MAAMFWVESVVRVKKNHSRFAGMVGVVKGIHLDEDNNEVFEVNLSVGEHWFSDDDLEHFATIADVSAKSAPDAEIARLREQVDTLTRERDAMREALELIAQAADRHEKFYIAAGRPSRPIIHIEWGQVLSIAREALGQQTPTATADAANALADGGE